MCLLDLTFFPLEVREGHIFPQFPAEALLSIGLLYNHGCVAELYAKLIRIQLHRTTILRCTRYPATKLWCITPPNLARHIVESPPDTPPHINNTTIWHTPYSTITYRIPFIHGAMGFPVPLTLCNTLDTSYLSSFLEITATLVRKYPPCSTATAQDHIDQQH